MNRDTIALIDELEIVVVIKPSLSMLELYHRVSWVFKGEMVLERTMIAPFLGADFDCAPSI